MSGDATLEGLLGAHSNYVFGENLDERRRLACQHDLLREDFDRWFAHALRLGGLPTDPEAARWSAVDVGCGEGQFARRVAERYPAASVLGMDADVAAIASAARAGAGLPNLRFAVGDARDGAAAEPGRRFHVAVLWLVLLYLPDRRRVLAELARSLEPGAVLLLCNQPDRPVEFSHPVADRLIGAAVEMSARVGAVGLEASLGEDLEAAGFRDVATFELRYPIGGGTAAGQRWWTHLLHTLAGGRRAIVDVGGLLTGDEFDTMVARLVGESMLRHSGSWGFLVTLARLARS